MDKTEFSSKLAELRRKSGIKMKDICFEMNTVSPAIYRIESGRGGIAIGTAIAFINAIKHRLIFQSPTSKRYKISSIEDAAKALKSIRESLNLSQNDVAEKSGITQRTIVSMEKGSKNTYMDSILNYLNSLNVKVKIE